jgi:hypothetical protein
MTDEIQAMANRLRELSGLLANPDLPDDQAEELAREAADLAARGGTMIDERMRELAEHGAPDPDG